MKIFISNDGFNFDSKFMQGVVYEVIVKHLIKELICDLATKKCEKNNQKEASELHDAIVQEIFNETHQIQFQEKKIFDTV